MIKISTITSFYRGIKYLNLFLKELPKQINFEEIQVVFNHNDPTVEELELIKKFTKEHPDRLKHLVVPKKPIGESWNQSIKESDGEIVSIWNIDDLRTPDSLLKQVQFLDNNLNYDICHGSFLIVNQFGSKHGKYIDHSIYKDNHPELGRGMVLGPYFAFRKNLCEKYGYFDEQFLSGCDYDFALRLHGNGIKIKY